MNQLTRLGLVAILVLFISCQNNATNQPEMTAVNTEEVSEDIQADQPESLTTENAPPSTTPKEEEKQLVNIKKFETPRLKPKAPTKKEIKVIAVKNTSPAESKSTPSSKIKKQTSKSGEELETRVIETTTSPIPSEEKIVAPSEDATEDPAPKAVFSHDAWNQLLTQYVSSTGKVNYRGLKAKQAKLEAYLDQLDKNPIQASWSRNAKMAYWINAYNAFTVKLILDNYPISSITKLEGGKVWDKKWIKLGGKTYSLNNIENDILRPTYKDARIHFAVNCAAKSCPPLLNLAWTAENLNANLNRQAKRFVNNSQFNQISADKVAISKIFEWYASDFGNIINYLNKYASTPINTGAKISYQEYDWALNQ